MICISDACTLGTEAMADTAATPTSDSEVTPTVVTRTTASGAEAANIRQFEAYGVVRDFAVGRASSHSRK